MPTRLAITDAPVVNFRDRNTTFEIPVIRTGPDGTKTPARVSLSEIVEELGQANQFRFLPNCYADANLTIPATAQTENGATFYSAVPRSDNGRTTRIDLRTGSTQPVTYSVAYHAIMSVRGNRIIETSVSIGGLNIGTDTNTQPNEFTYTVDFEITANTRNELAANLVTEEPVQVVISVVTQAEPARAFYLEHYEGVSV